jgi:hypothetical protein
LEQVHKRLDRLDEVFDRVERDGERDSWRRWQPCPARVRMWSPTLAVRRAGVPVTRIAML